MANFNRVILMGNLTRDPQLKYLPSNTAVCEFGLAVNHRWRDRDGNQKEEVCFVDLAAFGKAGEVINQYMTKGRPILVEGRLKLESWTGQDGQKRSKHTVVVDNFTFVGPRDQGGGGGGGGAPAGSNYRSAASGGDRPGPGSQERSGSGGYSGGGGGQDGPSYNDEAPTGENIPF
jgi:single-strand DNA-binding protein